MLHKRNRLRRARDFRQIRSRGRSWTSPLVVLAVYQRRGDAIRAGISVSKRVGKATVRNRVKRFMREALRVNLGQTRPGCDLILIARPAAATATYWDIREAVEALLHRSGLVQDAIHHA